MGQVFPCIAADPIIRPLVFVHGRETWSTSLRTLAEGALEKGAEEDLWGRKRDEETGEWRRLDNNKLHDLHPSPNIERENQER
jgi:hypothetical protein